MNELLPSDHIASDFMKLISNMADASGVTLQGYWAQLSTEWNALLTEDDTEFK